MKKQRKALEMNIHIFLTMSFQILISKITAKAEKELNKHYKSDYKEKIKLIKKGKKPQKSSSSLKSAISKQSKSPKPQTPKPQTPKPQTPKPPSPKPLQPGQQPGQQPGKKNKKKKK
jgi:uncharacterized protein YlxW (UPF0749 family)